jgi:hypothetical protein
VIGEYIGAILPGLIIGARLEENAGAIAGLICNPDLIGKGGVKRDITRRLEIVTRVCYQGKATGVLESELFDEGILHSGGIIGRITSASECEDDRKARRDSHNELSDTIDAALMLAMRSDIRLAWTHY